MHPGVVYVMLNCKTNRVLSGFQTQNKLKLATLTSGPITSNRGSFEKVMTEFQESHMETSRSQNKGSSLAALPAPEVMVRCRIPSQLVIGQSKGRTSDKLPVYHWATWPRPLATPTSPNWSVAQLNL